ncbi:glycine cleavage system protein GcvH [Tuwongella immobilis]|uniref:Glycine cleavage system H protein n=1 Tax=Tuwongella immobilis TaxID=692036 RepID=A0A6C2YM12_9BACT|nr:glycine cleavage system protein GcvH [Tuwongella immobilis]VIP02351.1 glycine cleavage system protein h : Glycine cleavage system H protein OS=Isosphaera pallida (strain ATCC 43644 / DSM 9630 / IS1B) GN=gcvH PE=3 SV=1: GCV_H [Tuwongella immobilis]VTS01139.1 glycine cleavage system protein h : Glycine cleavage system H protein OS=Isosphaera pallida (strain ATCC 43644 / DSM 9630 / IS1B) GN=gcvH PE=3 SV=1: GCV_H [Tuwongella immobilis]
MYPESLRYTTSHEWCRAEGSICTVGITQYAVDQLTDVTNLQLPKVGAKLTAGKPFGEIESVKAVFDLNSPITGEVVEVHTALSNDLAQINSSPYEGGWMLKVKLADGASLDHLLTAAQYTEQIAAEGH